MVVFHIQESYLKRLENILWRHRLVEGYLILIQEAGVRFSLALPMNSMEKRLIVQRTGSLNMERIKAPWTEEQVKALNSFQKTPWLHPFTCGSGNRTDEKHLDGEGLLVAKETGWECPYCEYKQDWAYEVMTKEFQQEFIR